MNAKEYLEILRSVSEVLGEAIHIVDADGRTIVYNEAMAHLEKTRVNDVLGKPFREAFPNIPHEESTLYRALTRNESTERQPQTYLNIYGKEITTVNSTVPVIVEGRTVAAIEAAKDITEIKNMSDTILELQEENLGARKTEAAAAKAASGRKTIKKYSFENIIGGSKSFLQVVERARKAARTDASVFIYGETGTGKELFAQSIHYAGSRKNKPFLAQNCAALPESLLEGILFGTAKGGFTGAVDRAGLFEQASGGTLLLDEISAMPYDLQSKLLRVLQESYIRRVGGRKDIPVDVRIIATVNESPAVLMERGELRSDLYYRLNIIGLEIPPLRERRDDIPVLAESFLRKHSIGSEDDGCSISEAAMKKLIKHDYPGNARELENIIISAVSMAEGKKVLTEKDLDLPDVSCRRPISEDSFDPGETSLAQHLEHIEKNIIEHTLSACGGNISAASKELGMLRQNMQHKIKKYNIDISHAKL